MITRTYWCSACEVEWEFDTDNPDEHPDPCLDCGTALTWMPKRLAINGDKSRAIDLAQQIAEQDYGLTNMRDNTRPGEIAAMAPSPPKRADDDQLHQIASEMAQQRPEVAEALRPKLAPGLQVAADRFFTGGYAGGSAAMVDALGGRQAVLGQAASTSAQDRAAGIGGNAVMESMKKVKPPILKQVIAKA